MVEGQKRLSSFDSLQLSWIAKAQYLEIEAEAEFVVKVESAVEVEANIKFKIKPQLEVY